MTILGIQIHAEIFYQIYSNFKFTFFDTLNLFKLYYKYILKKIEFNCDDLIINFLLIKNLILQNYNI
jgi:hypothetical protein